MEYRPAFLLRNAFSGKGRKGTGITRVAEVTEAQAAVMHKRRLSASGVALYNGRLRRAL
jgi:hypothetical protein